jgi:hypothetical protein
MKLISLKFALFSALFFAPVVISGCFCNCREVVTPEFYETTGLAGSVQYLNNTTNTSHFANDVVLSFTPQIRYYASAPCLQNKGGASVLACKCSIIDNEGVKGTPEKVKSIQITSNADFKNGYSSGIDLSPLMLVSADYHPAQIPQIDKRKLADFILTTPYAPKSFKLFFDASPNANKKHIFTMRYELDNGEVYTYTTPEITFQ